MFNKIRFVCMLMAVTIFVAACQKLGVDVEDVTLRPERPEKGLLSATGAGRIPTDIQGIPRVYINTPSKRGVQGIDSKRNYDANVNEWTTDCTIEIHVTTHAGKDSICYSAKDMKIRGRGNSTWTHYYRKRPYNIKLDKKADLLGTGKTKRYLLLANWMDRTLLRNDVALEAARRTSLEWTPSGTFVELYVDGDRRYNYWLGEKINVEETHFMADYLYSLDVSNPLKTNFITRYGIWNKGKKAGKIPVELEYPDLDDFPDAVEPAKEALYQLEELLYKGDWGPFVDADSFCDWFLVYELTGNAEPNHPKSVNMYIREGVLYAGPAWDFDFGTFIPDINNGLLVNQNAIYYKQLLRAPSFRERLKKRWSVLKPRFQTLPAYVDQRADLIRESEEDNHMRFPCYPNPLSTDRDANGVYTRMINYDEQMTFQEAVDRLKFAITQRIEQLDELISAL